MLFRVTILIACSMAAACVATPRDSGAPTLDGSSLEAFNASLKRMTAELPRYEREGVGLKVALMLGALACEPGEPPMSEEEMREALEDSLDELDGMTFEDIRTKRFNSEEEKRAAACGPWH